MIPLPTPFISAKTVQIETYPLELAIHPNPPTQAALLLHTPKGGRRLDTVRVAERNSPGRRKFSWVKYMGGAALTTREQATALKSMGFNADATLRDIESCLSDGKPRSAWSTVTVGLRLERTDALSDTMLALTTRMSNGLYTLLVVGINRTNKTPTGPQHAWVLGNAASPAAYWWPRLFNGAPVMRLYRTGDHYYSTDRTAHNTIQDLFDRIGLNPHPLAALKDDDE